MCYFGRCYRYLSSYYSLLLAKISRGPQTAPCPVQIAEARRGRGDSFVGVPCQRVVRELVFSLRPARDGANEWWN